jgi:hypothetical protein
LKATSFFFLIWFLVTLLSIKTFAQHNKTESLEEILVQIEKKFSVVFTYADEQIRGINISNTLNDLSLDDCLNELENQTNLKFKKLTPRYIAIQKKPGDGTVSGIIRDEHTKVPIEGAFIYTGEKYVISDSGGYFSIKVKQEEDSIIIVQHTGYKHLQLEQNLWANDTAIYELVPDVQEIEEVVVNYIAKGIDKLPDGSVQMNVQNLEVLPGLSEPDVLHSVQVLPGIQSINETVADINTRGGTNDQSLVLWDGVKMYQTGHFFGLISAFNSHLIHKTRVVKNGSNAYYDEGISGIIDMKQQDYLVNKFEINAGINMVSGDIVMKIPATNKLSLILGARHSINDVVETPTYKNYYNRAFQDTEVAQNQQESDSSVSRYHDFSFYDVSGKLIYDIAEKDKLQLSFLHINNTIEYEESVMTRDVAQSRQSRLSQSSILSNLDFSHVWNEDHLTYFRAYFSRYLLDGTNVSIADNEYHLQENEVIDWGVKLDTENKISNAISVTSGYQFKEIGIRNLDNIRDPGYFRDAKDVLRIQSVYTEAESKERLKNLYLRAGIRANYISKFNKFTIEPGVVLNYKLNSNFSIETMAEMKSQHTTQLIDYQTDFLGVEKRRWVLSNESSIPLLKSKQLSYGVQYNANNLIVSLEGYAKKVTGVISPSQGFQNQFQSVHASGEYNTHGLELLLNKRFKKSNFWTNYTWAKNDYYFKEFTPSNFPNNLDVRHTLSFGGTYTIHRFEVSGGGNYRTGKPYTKVLQEELDDNNEIVFEDPNTYRLGEYIRFDISAKYKFNFKTIKGEVGCSVWNVLNRDNVINIYYRKNENNEIEQITRHALGITPNFNLRFRF